MSSRLVSKSCFWVAGALLAVAAVAAEGPPPGGFPQGGPPPGAQPSPAARAIQYRKAVMTVISNNYGTLGGMLQGRTPFDGKVASVRADRVAFLAQLSAEAFPDDSKDGDTKAKPEVWSDKAGFEKVEKDFLDSSAALAAQLKKAPNDEAGFKAAAGKVGEACRNCHEGYRAR